jgi:FkbM family methyltransferase
MADLTMECRYGTLTFPKDHYIGKSLELLGEYSEAEVVFLASLLREGDVFVEAGANIGSITIPLAKKVTSQGKALVFEPQERIYKLLLENLEGNALTWVAPICKGLGEGHYRTGYTESKWNCGGVELNAAGENETEVITLDDLRLTRLDLLKLDVEGMEAEVLLGARDTIARCRPLIYAEDAQGEKGKRLLDVLFAANYRVWRHAPTLYNKANFRGCEFNPFDSIVSLNLFAVPAEREMPGYTGDLLGEVFPGQRRDAPSPKWACMVRMGGLGDNLISTSVLPGLKARWGHLEVITREPCHVVFENNPYVDKLTVWKKDEVIQDYGAWTRQMAARLAEYDFGIHLSHTCESVLALFEHQTQFGWPKKAREKLCGESYLGFIHDLCDLPHNFAPAFYPTEWEIVKAHDVIEGYRRVRNAPCVGWVLAGSRVDKAYPGSAAAISRLLELGLNVVMFGAPGREFLMAKEIERQVVEIMGKDKRGSAEGLHLCMSDNWDKPNWPIRRSLTQIQLCDLVVSPDTGPAWAVAMLQIPKVILVSHASPKNITHGWVRTTTLHADPERVECWPCHQLHDRWETCNKAKDVEAAACMADISVQSVVSAVRAGLNIN